MGHVFRPTSLAAREVALGEKILKSVVVCINNDRRTKKFDPPLVQATDDCKELLLMDQVVQGGVMQWGRVEGNRSCRLPIGAPGQDSTCSGVRGIGCQENMVISGVIMVDSRQAQRASYEAFDPVESFLETGRPIRE